MLIHYFFIFKYKAIENVGIRLNGRYDYAMDTDKKVMTMSENPNWVEGFWPEGVSTLTAIVGSNGSGKTTFMEAMLLMVEKGNDGKEVDAMIVCQDRQGEFFAYLPEGRECKIEGLSVEPKSNPPKIELFYYSSYFHTNISVTKPRTGELQGVYNASDTWRLVKDLLEYSNNDTISRTRDLHYHIDTMKAQDGNRIVQLIADKELRNCLPKNALPEYILINPNHSGYNYFTSHPNDKFKLLDVFAMSPLGDKEQYLAGIVYSCFTNIAAQFESVADAIFDEQTEWEKLYNKTKNASTALRTLNFNTYLTGTYLKQLIGIVDFLRDNFEYDMIEDTLYLKLESAKEETITQLIHYFQAEEFIVAHYFDLSFSRTTADTTQLSSGEYDLLKLFSRIYDAVRLSPEKFANLESPALVLLDEAENSYHPEWQRRFVKMLTDFLSALFMAYNDVPEFQVVLTTHSPILLSDIPVVCTNYLRREGGGGKIMLHKAKSETFGANIYDLYKDSFFMEDGLMGEYAYEWIERLRNQIDAENVWSDTKADGYIQMIERIGDEVIRRYLFQLLEKKNKPSMVAYYKRKLQELEGGK